jgi:HEAT repeat protein
MHRVEPTDTDARLKSLMADQDVEIRRQAASVLPELRGFDPIEIFIAALEDADDQVSKASRQFLAKSDSPRAQEALQQYMVARIEKLLPTLSERDLNVRRKAQTDLLGLGPEVAPLLMDRLLQMEDALAMTALGQVIGATRNSVVLPHVIAQIENVELADERRMVFENVLRYFPEAMSKKAVELAKSGEPPLRLSGVRLLASVGDGAGGEVLKEALKDTDQRVRAFAAYGLARARDPDALEVLKELAVQNDRAIQQQAIVGLSNYDEESALPTVQKLLAAEDPQVRNIALSLLGRYKSPQVTALIVETAAADEALGRQAMSVLSQQNTADAARALGEYLKNADADVQRQAQALLQRMRVPEARDILQEFRQQQEEAQKAKSEAEKEKADG